MSGNQVYCRLCLRSDGFLVSIFEDKSERIEQLIEEVTTVVIREDEADFPPTICTGCLRYVESIKTFKSQCVKNDELIRKGMFGQAVKAEFDEYHDVAADVTFSSSSPAAEECAGLEEDVKEEQAESAESVEEEEEDFVDEDFPEETYEVKPKKKRKPYKKRAKKVKHEAEANSGELKAKKKQQNRTLKVCYICGKTTTNQTLHLIRHSDLTPYKCDYPECTKAYKTYLGLRYHKYTHTDYRPHVCEICGRGFARRSKMVVHMLVHTNERNFPCELCGKAFKQRYNLIAHRRTHTDDRKEKCLECGKCFLTRHELGKHARIHRNDEHPYKCSICTYSTLYKASLNSHMNKVHGLNH
ncbi:zinc finger protein 3 homolog [Phlebotomus argentipes]|uniref:zinc finger protein 3 homolog n=1 Tax=Phlebotomus argentipes TaxID=94469 RepID=UPI0028935A51|nr:zinc finger protein 3 homolog [Phlebotomus argentipes]